MLPFNWIFIFCSFVFILLLSLINSTLESNKVSTRKKTQQQNKKFLSQLSKCDADFMIRLSNHETQTESWTNVVDRNTFPNDTNDPAQVNSPQVDMHTL